MSKKNTKIEIKIPKYDVEGQLNFLTSVCTSFNFDVRTLITLIFADWINLFQLSSIELNGNSEKAFYSFLSTCEKTASKLKELREEIKNEGK